MLGLPGTVQDAGWTLHVTAPGSPLGEPKPLFKKLDDSIVTEETAKLGA
jgi:hypothetical protein